MTKKQLVVIRQRRSNQSILKEINPEYSLEGLILNAEVPVLWHLMQRAKSLEKTLMLGKIKGKRRRRWQRMRRLDSTADSIDMNLSKLQETVEDRGACCATLHACMLSCSSLPDSLRPYALWPIRFLCPWDSPGKNTGSPGDLPELRIEQASLSSPALAGGSLPLAPPGKPCTTVAKSQTTHHHHL